MKLIVLVFLKFIICLVTNPETEQEDQNSNFVIHMRNAREFHANHQNPRKKLGLRFKVTHVPGGKARPYNL